MFLMYIHGMCIVFFSHTSLLFVLFPRRKSQYEHHAWRKLPDCGRVGRDMVFKHRNFSEFSLLATTESFFAIFQAYVSRGAGVGDALWVGFIVVRISIYLFFCTNISLRSISVYIARAHPAGEEEIGKRSERNLFAARRMGWGCMPEDE